MKQSSTTVPSVKPNTAEIIAFDRGGKLPVERSEYAHAVQLWIDTRDVAEALSNEEIGALTKEVRIDAQRKSLIINLARYYRLHKRADVAPGVLAVITLLSDNEDGLASVSQPTLGKLFDRSPSAIREAQKHLKGAELIVMGRGRYAGAYPIIPKVVTEKYNHLTWLIGAIANHGEPSNVQDHPADCQSARRPGGLKPSGRQSARRPGTLDQINPPDSSVQSAGGSTPYFLDLTSTETKCLNNNIVQPEKKSGCLSTEVVDDLSLGNDQLGFSTWKVAAGIMAIGVAFGANQLPASAITIGAEPGVGREYAKQMAVGTTTLTAGADGMPFRYNVPWSTASTAHEAREAATEGVPVKKKKEKTAPGEYTRDFEEFWKIYPRREGKGLAFKSWQKLTIERKRIAYVALKKQLQVLIARANDNGRNFCPLPATWINQCRFDDDVEQMELAKKAQQQQKNDYSLSGEYTGFRL